jgi:hypothetical protein
VRLGVESRGLAIGLGERLCQRPSGQPVELSENVVRGIVVHLGVRADAHPFLHPEHLEQGELQVAEVGLVVTHVFAPTQSWTGSTNR